MNNFPRGKNLEVEPIMYPVISIITPAFNEEQNLPILYQRLQKVLADLDLEWEWIVIDDHSSDRTFEVISKIANNDSRVSGIRFARNFGSHVAMVCGLNYSNGNCAVVLAADLQDPPETLPALLAEWKAGYQVVWAVREHRSGEKATTLGFARGYYWLMRHVVGMKELPASGADFFLLDRTVIDAFKQFSERNVSILALITWMGFRQGSICYDKNARIHGKSGWGLEKKLKLVVDSVTSFTYLPIRLMSYFGFTIALLGFLYAAFIIRNAFLIGSAVEGWSSLMVVVLIMGGLQMLMMGVLGEYLWRTWDEARQRPRYLIEIATGGTGKNASDHIWPRSSQDASVSNNIGIAQSRPSERTNS